MSSRKQRALRKQIRAAASLPANTVICAGGEATIVAASSDDQLPTFSLVGYTGGKMRPSGFKSDVVVDLAGMRVENGARPILLDHNPGAIVGHADVDVTATEIMATGTVSGGGSAAQEVVKAGRQGFPWKASIGAAIEASHFLKSGEVKTVNGREIAGPAHVVTKSRLNEVSFVSLAADDSTSAMVASLESEDSQMTVKDILAALDSGDLSEEDRASLEAAFTKAPEEKKKEKPSIPEELTAEAQIASLRAESKRLAEIDKIAAKYPELRAQAIDGELSMKELTCKVEVEELRASREMPAIHIEGVSQADVSKVIECSMLTSLGEPESVLSTYSDQVREQSHDRRWRNYGIQRLMGDFLRVNGRTSYEIDDEGIEMAFRIDNQLRAASGFSTISLSGLLSNIANKSMLSAYNSIDGTIERICSSTVHQDFKQYTKYRMTGLGTFEQVGATGEIKHMELTEESFVNQVETYARMISLNRQMIINDDLGAFAAIPRILGRGAALKFEEVGYTLLLSNPGSFFSSGNGNYQEGAGTALTADAAGIATLTAAELLFLNQTDADGKPIMLTPSILLVGTALKNIATQLMSDAKLIGQGSNATAILESNVHVSKWTPLATPYLNAQGISGGSATQWYLIANPSDIAMMEVAYLNGTRSPVISSADTDFKTLGMQWRGYMDFGFAMQDTKAGVKSKGAA